MIKLAVSQQTLTQKHSAFPNAQISLRQGKSLTKEVKKLVDELISTFDNIDSMEIPCQINKALGEKVHYQIIDPAEKVCSVKFNGWQGDSCSIQSHTKDVNGKVTGNKYSVFFESHILNTTNGRLHVSLAKELIRVARIENGNVLSDPKKEEQEIFKITLSAIKDLISLYGSSNVKDKDVKIKELTEALDQERKIQKSFRN